jgi:hypothetical protein
VQIERMDAAAFFGLFAELLKDNPPGPQDYPMIHRLERVGFRVGQSFDLNAAAPDIKQAFERATAAGQEGGWRRRPGLGLQHDRGQLWRKLPRACGDCLFRARGKPAAGCRLPSPFNRQRGKAAGRQQPVCPPF